MKVILLLIAITCLNVFIYSQSDKRLNGVEKELYWIKSVEILALALVRIELNALV